MTVSKPISPAPGWHRSPAPSIKQERLTCWAAAAAAWVKATPRSPAAWWLRHADDAIEQYDQWTAEGGSLTVTRNGQDDPVPSGLEMLVAGLGLDIRIFGRKADGRAVAGRPPPRALSGAFLHRKLRQHSHLYLIFEEPGAGFSHAVVVHEITGATGRNAAIRFMEPMKGFPAFRSLSLQQLHKMRVVILGWLDPAAQR